MKNSWGYHLRFEATNIQSNMGDKKYLATFIKDLVNLINMEAYGEPHIVHFGNDYLEGDTAIQLISTSNICVHFNDADNSCYFDLFSCKPFNEKTVINYFDISFNPSVITWRMENRQAKRNNWLNRLIYKIRMNF